MSSTTRKAEPAVANGVTIQWKEPQTVTYGARGQRYPYEEATAALNSSAETFKGSNEDRPWLSLRIGPRKRMDQFAARFRKYVAPRRGWSLQVITRQTEDQDNVNYKQREVEVFARLVRNNQKK